MKLLVMNSGTLQHTIATGHHPDTMVALEFLCRKLQESLKEWDDKYTTLSHGVSFEVVGQRDPGVNPEERVR